MPLATLGKAAAKAPVPLDVVSGSYTGDGTTDRVIPLPFTPKLVMVTGDGSTTPLHISPIHSSTNGWTLYNSANPFVGALTNLFPRLTTNGFIVTGSATNDVNQTGRGFNYVAFA